MTVLGLLAGVALVVLLVGREADDQALCPSAGNAKLRTAEGPKLGSAGDTSQVGVQGGTEAGSAGEGLRVEVVPSVPPEGGSAEPVVASWRDAMLLWNQGRRQEALAGVRDLRASSDDEGEEIQLRLLQAVMAGVLGRPAETLDALLSLLETLCRQFDPTTAATPTVLSRVQSRSLTSLARALSNIENLTHREPREAATQPSLRDPLDLHMTRWRRLASQAQAPSTTEDARRAAELALAGLDLELWARRVSTRNGLGQPTEAELEEFRSIRARFRRTVAPFPPDGLQAAARWLDAWIRSLEAREPAYR